MDDELFVLFLFLVLFSFLSANWALKFSSIFHDVISASFRGIFGRPWTGSQLLYRYLRLCLVLGSNVAVVDSRIAACHCLSLLFEIIATTE
jgi:hypothetical protein